jgi:hypothetical protein
MRFLIDANTPRSIIALVANLGHKVEFARDGDEWGFPDLCLGSALFLKSATPSAAVSKQEEGNHKDGNDQSDRTNPPARTHTPIQTSATTK